MPVGVSVRWATDTAFDLWQLSHPIKEPAPARRDQQSWRAPEAGWIKCNVDAAFQATNGTAASGLALRDYEGRVCGGRAKWYDHCLNALTAEALACRNGMLYAQERGVQKLMLETDCQVLVNLWSGRACQKSEIDSLLKQMDGLSRSFEALELMFISRNCNILAHECARLVSRDNQVEEWHITPLGVRDIVDSDCNLVHG